VYHFKSITSFVVVDQLWHSKCLWSQCLIWKIWSNWSL